MILVACFVGGPILIIFGVCVGCGIKKCFEKKSRRQEREERREERTRRIEDEEAQARHNYFRKYTCTSNWCVEVVPRDEMPCTISSVSTNVLRGWALPTAERRIEDEEAQSSIVTSVSTGVFAEVVPPDGRTGRRGTSTSVDT